MIKRLFVTALSAGLILGATALAAPLVRATWTSSGEANPAPRRPEPRPQGPTVKKEVAEPSGRALCLAISPDSKTLAAGCTDRSVRLLDAVTGETRIVLAGVSRGYVRGVAFMSDGRTVVGLADDNQVRFWDTTSGKEQKTLAALEDLQPDGLPRTLASALALSPDGGTIAVGGAGTSDGTGIIRSDEKTYFEIRVRDTNTGELLWSHLGRRGFLNQLAFSRDGRTLASTMGPEVKLWDARSGDLKQTVKPRAGSIWALAFSPDDRYLAGYGVAVIDEKRASWLSLWDLRTGAIVHTIEAGEAGGAAAPGTLAFSPDGLGGQRRRRDRCGADLDRRRADLHGAEGDQRRPALGCRDRHPEVDLAGRGHRPRDVAGVRARRRGRVLLRRVGHQPHRRQDGADPPGSDDYSRTPSPVSRRGDVIRTAPGPRPWRRP